MTGRNLKKSAALLLAAVLLLCAAACGRKTYREIPLGDGLPTWQLAQPYTAAKLPADADERGLTAIYTADDGACVRVYRYEKKPGTTLEDEGQELAAAYQVFCNRIEVDGCPCANVTYYETVDGVPCIVRAYLFEGTEEFVKLCFLHETEQIPLAESDLQIRLMSGYTKAENLDSLPPHEAEYTYADADLPTVRIWQRSKADLQPELYDAGLSEKVTAGQLAAYARDGWTQEEIVSLYDGAYDLLKGELIRRNGFDVGFIGYIDTGVFYVKAFIDYGEDYIVLCAENDAAKFQHVVNALIDTIG